MGQALELAAGRNEDRVFLADVESGRRWTYRETWAAVASGRDALSRAGLARGSSAVSTQPDGVELVLTLLTCLAHGVRLTLLGSVAPSPRMRELVRLTEPSLILGAEPAGDRLAPGAARLDTLDFTSAPVETRPVVTEVTDEAFVIFSSGTTGHPKGVVHTHGNILTAVDSLAEAQGLPDAANHLAVLSMSHVSGLYRSMLLPFLTGGTVHLWRSFSPERFWRLVASLPVHAVQLVPSHIALLNLSDHQPPPGVRETLLLLGSASAPLPVREQTRFEDRFGIPVMQGYGQTEATCAITAASRDPAKRTRGGSGRPLAVNEVRILDAAGEPVPAGETGEIAIRGANVATRWIGATLPPMPGGWRRTGDLGLLGSTGELRVVGRRVRVINRGGEKVHPAEVEEALLGLEGVREAAVVGRPHPVLGEDVVALVVLEHDVAPHRLIESLRGRLEEFKIPGEIRAVSDLPRNARGKVPLAALRRLAASAPSDPAQGDVVAATWKQVLGIEPTGETDDFFHIGGSSLQAILVGSTVGRILGKPVPEAALFDHPTLGEFRAFVDGLPALPRPPDSRRPPPRASRRGRDLGPFPLTSIQQLQWNMARKTDFQSKFTIGLRVELLGPLDPSTLKEALAQVVRRHDALRLVLDPGQPQQRVVTDVPIPFDFQRRRDPERLERFVDRFFTRSFDITKAPLCRMALVEAGPQHHHLLITAHHIILDGWSRDLILRDLGVAYRHRLDGIPWRPPPLPMSFGQYARVESNPVLREKFMRQSRRRRRALQQHGGELLEFKAHLTPRERERRLLGSLTDRIDAPTTLSLRRVAARTRTSVTMLLTAVFERILAESTGQRRFFLTVPVLSQVHPGAQEVAGNFANSTILAVDCPGELSWADHLDAVRREMLEALKHRHSYYNHVHRGTPGIRATINVFPGGAHGFEAGGLVARSLPLKRYRNLFALGARFEPQLDWIHMDFAYCTPHLGRADVLGFVATYHTRLREMLTELGD